MKSFEETASFDRLMIGSVACINCHVIHDDYLTHCVFCLSPLHDDPCDSWGEGVIWCMGKPLGIVANFSFSIEEAYPHRLKLWPHQAEMFIEHGIVRATFSEVFNSMIEDFHTLAPWLKDYLVKPEADDLPTGYDYQKHNKVRRKKL